MPRTHVFVSYSHVDSDWRDRLTTHLAVLRRPQHRAVELWTDSTIRVGESWKDVIDEQLRQCRIAILLVTPSFLASAFIQEEEVKTLLERHAADGLDLLPVIARPCAWKLVDWLARLQCRPDGGRALSLGTEAEVDVALAMLTYEIGTLLGESHPGVRSDMAQLESTTANQRFAGGRNSSQLQATADPLPVQSWRGTYSAVSGDSAQSMHLILDSLAGSQLRGRIAWPNKGTTTSIVGDIADGDAAITFGADWQQVRQRAISPHKFLRFTDTRQDGGAQLELGGDYRAVIEADGTIVGLWYRSAADAAPIGQFRLTLTPA